MRATGIVQVLGLAEVGVMSVPNRPGVAADILGALAARDVNVPFIVEITDPAGRAHLVLCVREELLETALAEIDRVASGLLADRVVRRCDVALVAVQGPHFRDRPGSGAEMCRALASVGVDIFAISTSVSSIACVIGADRLPAAVRALQDAFGVDDDSVVVAANGLTRRQR